MKYIVYCTTCLVNGKIYIGVHKTENPNIFDGYIGNGLKIGYNIKNPHTAFQHAIKKYGYNNFKRSTLFIFNTPEEAYNKEAEIVTKDFVKDKMNYNISLGGICSGIVYDSLYQYDYKGNFIKEWNSITEAIKYFGCNSNRFNMAITSKRSAFNSYWSKNKYDKLDVSKYTKSKHSEIYCYDADGNFIKLYDSVKTIVRDLGFTKTSIEDALSHKKLLKGYYFINDLSNIMNIIKTKQYIHNITDKSVSKYKNGILIQTYPSLKRAALENNLKISQIKDSIKNSEGIWAYGYSEYFIERTKPIGVKVNQYDLEGNLVKVWDSIAACAKTHPKVRDVLKGCRNQTHGYKFSIS